MLRTRADRRLTALGTASVSLRAVRSPRECHARTAPLALICGRRGSFKENQRNVRPCRRRSRATLRGETLKQSVTGQGIVESFGGEEFAVILPRTRCVRR